MKRLALRKEDSGLLELADKKSLECQRLISSKSWGGPSCSGFASPLCLLPLPSAWHEMGISVAGTVCRICVASFLELSYWPNP